MTDLELLWLFLEIPFRCCSRSLMNSSLEFGMSRLGLLREGLTLRVDA